MLYALDEHRMNRSRLARVPQPSALHLGVPLLPWNDYHGPFRIYINTIAGSLSCGTRRRRIVNRRRGTRVHTAKGIYSCRSRVISKHDTRAFFHACPAVTHACELAFYFLHAAAAVPRVVIARCQFVRRERTRGGVRAIYRKFAMRWICELHGAARISRQETEREQKC